MKKQPKNYLTLVPIRQVTEFSDDGKIILLIPKFKNVTFRNWFIPKRKSTHFNIHLDEMGSQVWRFIDATRTVEEICALLNEFLLREKKPSHQLEERVTKFLTDLLKNEFIRFNEAEPLSNE